MRFSTRKLEAYATYWRIASIPIPRGRKFYWLDVKSLWLLLQPFVFANFQGIMAVTKWGDPDAANQTYLSTPISARKNMFSDPLFFLAQSTKVTNWLTPVWIMSVGITIGFVLVLLMLLKIFLLQKTTFFNSVTENPTTRIIAGLLTSLAYVAMFLGLLYWHSKGELFNRDQFENYLLPILITVPLCFIIGFGVWKLVSRRMQGELYSFVTQGFLSWLNKVCIAMAIFAVIGLGLAMVNGFGLIKFVDDPTGMMQSLVRLPMTGEFSKEFTIPPSPKDHPGDPIEVNFHGSELEVIVFDTDRRLEVASEPITPLTSERRIFKVQSPDGRPVAFRQGPDGGRIPADEQIDVLYFNNLGSVDANVKLTWLLAPIYNEVSYIPWIAASVVSVYLFYLIFAAWSPKVAAIAFSTFKTEVNQPLFTIVMVLGVVFILGTIYVPYNTFGEDIKMYKDSGLTLIRVLAIFLAIWAASKSVAEEIEGRTALTVLSKPVGRRQFVLGKFTGIALSIAVLFIVLGLWFYIWVAYKPVYDYQESSKGIAEWTVCFNEAIHILPGLFLCFLEVLIFVAISVAISTRFGILANFLVCFSIYVLGHLTPLIVQSSFAAFEPVVVFGQLIAIVFPVLNHFDVQAAISTNAPVPFTYLAWAVIYTGLYGTMATLLALVFFEDRDLA